MLNKLIEVGAVAAEFIDKDNEYYMVNASLLKDTSGKFSRILIVENNITQQKKTEESLEKNIEEQRRLNLLKSRFVSFASHEFRTPLTTMSSSADLIRKYVELDDKEKISKHITRIQQSVVLDKIDSGVVNLNVQRIDLSKLLEECLEETAGVKKIGQEIQVMNAISCIETDPFLLKSILINLISNGLKYSDEKSSVLVTTAIESNEFVICIKDHGMGIPQSELQNLFTRFFRASNAQEIKGTGLGLHIVSRHVDMLGGKIICESEEGIGTQFCVYLPWKQLN
jgi:signal transduction histidine kinase